MAAALRPPSEHHVATRRLLRYDELWARAYAQYVTTRSVDRALMADLDARRQTPPGQPSLPTQWADDDFAPVAATIDHLFRGLGWIE